MQLVYEGALKKLRHQSDATLKYFLEELALNDLIGRQVKIEFLKSCECVACARKIKKTYSQGYCFPCSQKLARCDICILKPELCHYHKGTCREPEWGEENCLIEHAVYLANTTGLKVGITRAHQVKTRWGDQGALAATILALVPERLKAGKLEVALKKHTSDKTNWRALLKGETAEVDLLEQRKRFLEFIPEEFSGYVIAESEVYTFDYPVNSYLEKAKTYNLEKVPIAAGELKGIRGQYMFIGDAALNARKWAGYLVRIFAD